MTAAGRLSQSLSYGPGPGADGRGQSFSHDAAGNQVASQQVSPTGQISHPDRLKL